MKEWGSGGCTPRILNQVRQFFHEHWVTLSHWYPTNEQPRMQMAMASENLPSSLAFKNFVRVSLLASFYLIVCLETFSLGMFFEELGPGRWLQSKSPKKQLLNRELKWMKIGNAEGCRDCKGCGSLQHLFLVAGVCPKIFGPLWETKAISRSLAELVLVFLRAGAWLPGCTFPDGRNGFANIKQQQPNQHYSHD